MNIIKIQLNLYEHRIEDNSIIKNLGLDSCDNPNKRVKESLCSLASNTDIQFTANQNTSKLLKELENAKSEIQKLMIENDILKQSSTNISHNTSPSEIIHKEKDKTKINDKLLASAKNIEL